MNASIFMQSMRTLLLEFSCASSVRHLKKLMLSLFLIKDILSLIVFPPLKMNSRSKINFSMKHNPLNFRALKNKTQVLRANRI